MRPTHLELVAAMRLGHNAARLRVDVSEAAACSRSKREHRGKSSRWPVGNSNSCACWNERAEAARCLPQAAPPIAPRWLACNAGRDVGGRGVAAGWELMPVWWAVPAGAVGTAAADGCQPAVRGAGAAPCQPDCTSHLRQYAAFQLQEASRGRGKGCPPCRTTKNIFELAPCGPKSAGHRCTAAPTANCLPPGLSPWSICSTRSTQQHKKHRQAAGGSSGCLPIIPSPREMRRGSSPPMSPPIGLGSRGPVATMLVACATRNAAKPLHQPP